MGVDRLKVQHLVCRIRHLSRGFDFMPIRIGLSAALGEVMMTKFFLSLCLFFSVTASAESEFMCEAFCIKFRVHQGADGTIEHFVSSFASATAHGFSPLDAFANLAAECKMKGGQAILKSSPNRDQLLTFALIKQFSFQQQDCRHDVKSVDVEAPISKVSSFTTQQVAQ